MRLAIVKTPLGAGDGMFAWHCFEIHPNFPEVIWRGLGHRLLELEDAAGKDIIKSMTKATELQNQLATLFETVAAKGG